MNIGWAVPFIWATIWGLISMYWCKRDMVRERLEWQATKGPIKVKQVGLDSALPGSASDSEHSRSQPTRPPEPAV